MRTSVSTRDNATARRRYGTTARVLHDARRGRSTLQRSRLFVSGFRLAWLGQVAVAGTDDAADVPDQIGDADAMSLDADQRAVATVGGDPFGPADGGGGVASSGAKASVSACVEQLKDPAAGPAPAGMAPARRLYFAG